MRREGGEVCRRALSQSQQEDVREKPVGGGERNSAFDDTRKTHLLPENRGAAMGRGEKRRKTEKKGLIRVTKRMKVTMDGAFF